VLLFRKHAQYALAIALLVGLLIQVALAGTKDSSSVPIPERHEKYDLEITLATALNRDVSLETTIQVGVPFKATATNGAIMNTISGTLQSPADGKFPLKLMISEWKSSTENDTETSEYHLELNKPSEIGVEGGIASLYIVVLRPHQLWWKRFK